MPRLWRWVPVLALFLLAPWMAELSWGGIPYTQIPLVWLFLGPLYGGAAILIRDVARRTGRGWPTMLLWAAAFGVFQAGVIDQSLFNADYGGEDYTHPVHVRWLGISLVNLIAFVSGHVVASIGVPIAFVEGAVRLPRAQPWLGRAGLAGVALLYGLACLVNHIGVKDEEGDGFQARPAQTAIALGVVTALLVAGLLVRRTGAQQVSRAGWVPPVWSLLVGGGVAYWLYLPVQTVVGVVVATVTILAVVLVVWHWSRSSAWTPTHLLALAAGAALTGVVQPFLVEPYGEDPPPDSVSADIVAASVCLALVATVWWMHARQARTGRAEDNTAGPGFEPQSR